MFLRSPNGNSRVGQRHRCFFHGMRFAGQRSLVGSELCAFEKSQIRRNNSAGFQDDDVARNKFRSRELTFVSAADHIGNRCSHLLESFERAFRAVFLDETDDAVQKNDRANDDGVFKITDDSGKDGRCDQNKDHEVGELANQYSKRRAAFLQVQSVPAVYG